MEAKNTVPIIVWSNNSDFAGSLSVKIPNSAIAVSRDELHSELEKNKKINSMIVLAELIWDHQGKVISQQEFAGVNLIKTLRRDYDLNVPVLFVSFMPLKTLLKPDREIITAISHGYLQLPATPQQMIAELNKLNKLSPVELLDIQLFSCSPAGIINSKLHQLSGISQIVNIIDNKEIRKVIIQCLEEIHEVYHESPAMCISDFNNKFTSIDKKNINEVLQHVYNEGQLLINKYSTGLQAEGNKEVARKPWTALLVDDEIGTNSLLAKKLDEAGVDLVYTDSGEKALEILKRDDGYRNMISIIISDYRLNEVKNNLIHQQKMQGYSFLQRVGEDFRSRILNAIVYSGMPRKFLMETFSSFTIRPEIFSKKDYAPHDEQATSILVNRIIEKGEDAYNTMVALPISCKGWENHLHKTYLLYRNLQDYPAMEYKVCEFCTEWVKEFRIGNNPASPMIKGDAFGPKKNEKEEDTINRFIAYYKTRRLAQFLHLFFENKNEDSSDKIISTLAHPDRKMDSPSAKRGFFSQILGFKKEEFPLGSTMEDLLWFERDLQIPVLGSYKKFRIKMNEAEQKLGKYISGNSKLKNDLVTKKYSFVGKNKQQLYFNPSNNNPYFFDTSDLGISMEWINTHLDGFSESELNDYVSINGQLWS